MTAGSKRALRIVLGYLAACLIASVALFVESALVAAILQPVSLSMTWTFLTESILRGTLVAPLLAVAALPPAALGIGLAEWNDYRGRIAHVAWGAMVLIFCVFSLGIGTMSVDDGSGAVPKFSLRDLASASLLYIGPGLLAGLVYWQLRGARPQVPPHQAKGMPT